MTEMVVVKRHRRTDPEVVFQHFDDLVTALRMASRQELLSD